MRSNEQIERRYRLNPQGADAQKHLFYYRSDWCTENNLHGILDGVFHKDKSQIRKENAAENMGTIRKMVLNLVRKYKKRAGDISGIPLLRLCDGWDDIIALGILGLAS
jgi:hypothetical protein